MNINDDFNDSGVWNEKGVSMQYNSTNNRGTWMNAFLSADGFRECLRRELVDYREGKMEVEITTIGDAEFFPEDEIFFSDFDSTWKVMQRASKNLIFRRIS